MQPSKRGKTRPRSILRFGERPARGDRRNLMFAAVLKAPLAIIPEYDFDVVHHSMPTPMLGNEVHGDPERVLPGSRRARHRAGCARFPEALAQARVAGGEEAPFHQGIRRDRSHDSVCGQARRLSGLWGPPRLHLPRLRHHPVPRRQALGRHDGPLVPSFVGAHRSERPVPSIAFITAARLPVPPYVGCRVRAIPGPAPAPGRALP
jgi:hypothetical protein